MNIDPDQLRAQAKESLKRYEASDMSNLCAAQVVLDVGLAMAIGVDPASIGDVSELIKITKRVQDHADLTMKWLIEKQQGAE